MMDLTRKQILQRLVTMKSYAIGEDYEALEYAINSLKTDEAYQLMYEGEEIYTKADMAAMLEDLKQDIIAESWHIECYDVNANDLVVQISDVDKVIQQKIDAFERQLKHSGGDGE